MRKFTPNRFHHGVSGLGSPSIPASSPSDSGNISRISDTAGAPDSPAVSRSSARVGRSGADHHDDFGGLHRNLIAAGVTAPSQRRPKIAAMAGRISP
jgi:hypothetical protein